MSDEQSQLNERAREALLRKIDLRLMSLLTLLNFFSFLDRINIGNKRNLIYILHTICLLFFFRKGSASLFGLEHNLNLSPSDYNWAVSIFFISYVSS